MSYIIIYPQKPNGGKQVAHKSGLRTRNVRSHNLNFTYLEQNSYLDTDIQSRLGTTAVACKNSFTH